MPTLYVAEPGAHLAREYHRLLVVKDDEVLLRVPLQRITQVVLIGRVGVTTPALHALLQQDTPLLLVQRSGRLVGRLLPATPGNLPRRRQQYRRNDDDAFCLQVARAIVAAKIRNQRTLALRLLRRHPHLQRGRIDALPAAARQAAACPDLPTLRGIEGLAARRYFFVYRQSFHPDYAFHRRTRRPPTDPVNALLSLGYTFLTQAMITALEAAGLDPYLGYFHSETYNRPALALDLVEEFRTPVVDSLVLSLLNRRWLDAGDFQPDPDGPGVVLTPRGFRVFLRAYSQKLESTFHVRDLGRTLSYRKLFEVQARRLARVIEGSDAHYRPFRLR